MNVFVKRVVEIAAGVVVGGLMSDAVDKVVEVSVKAVKNAKKAK